MEPIELYKRYVHERQMVWERRQIGLPAPWSDDPILNELKFCNNFRVLDRGSQYVLRMVQDAHTKGDVVLRAFLYRFTNMEVVWEIFLNQHGRWPIEEDLSNGILEQFILETGKRMNLFNPAYLLSPGMNNKGMTRPEWLVKTMYIAEEELLHNEFYSAPMAEKHMWLRGIPRCADFLAMQVLTDIGYSDILPQDENEFVVPGLGALRGLDALGYHSRQSISAMRDLQEHFSGSIVLDVKGTERPLSLMDIQNTLCEFGKYHRAVSGVRSRPRKFHPAGTPADPIYPNHWSV